MSVDGLLVEYFGYSAHVARELPRQPDIASALPVQFVFNQFSYVRNFFHFAFGEPHLVMFTCESVGTVVELVAAAP